MERISADFTKHSGAVEGKTKGEIASLFRLAHVASMPDRAAKAHVRSNGTPRRGIPRAAHQRCWGALSGGPALLPAPNTVRPAKRKPNLHRLLLLVDGPAKYKWNTNPSSIRSCYLIMLALD